MGWLPGVYAEGIISAAAGMTFEDGIGLVDAVKQAAGAACNDPLIHPQTAIFDLAAQIQLYVLSAHQLLHVLLALVQDILQVGVQLLNGECVGRVHRQGDHGADTGQIHRDQAIVIGQLCRSQGLIILLSAMCSQETAGGLVCFPNRGQAGGLGGHCINGIAGILTQRSDARAYKFHDLVLDIAALEQLAHQRNGHIVGAAASRQRSGEVDGHHAGPGHIVGAAQQLLCQLAAALTDGHSAQSTITGMRVRTKDHFAAAGKLLPHILVDHRQVGRNKDPAVFLSGGQTKPVVVLIDRPPHRTQAVVAVGEHIRDRETLQPGSPRCLDNAHKGDIVAGHGIELQLQCVVIPAVVMRTEDAIGHRAFLGLGCCSCIKALGRQYLGCVFIRRDPFSTGIVGSAAGALNHIQHFHPPLFFHDLPPGSPGRPLSAPSRAGRALAIGALMERPPIYIAQYTMKPSKEKLFFISGRYIHLFSGADRP